MIWESAIAVSLASLLAASLEVGFRTGRRASAAHGDSNIGPVVGAIQGATLGLLGLLLGFSFAAATGRFLERQDLIVQEANAIGTAYLRADVLDEPHRARLRGELTDYVERRLELSKSLRNGVTPAMMTEMSAFHTRIWESAREGAAAKPATMVLVLPAVNEVLDLHTSRIAAGRKHLPVLVLGLLIVCSALAMSVVGYSCGLAGRRFVVLAGSLTILVGVSLWTTIDLDHPRIGLIQVDDSPLRELEMN